MKKALLLLLLFIGTFATHAATTINMVNNTPCKITIRIFRLDPKHCIPNLGSPVLIAPNSTTPVIVPKGTGPWGVETYYTDCPINTSKTSWHTSCFPATDVIAGCGKCSRLGIVWAHGRKGYTITLKTL